MLVKFSSVALIDDFKYLCSFFSFADQPVLFCTWSILQPRGFKTFFFMLNSAEHKFKLLKNAEISQNKLKIVQTCNVLLINVKMPTIVGILTFISRISSLS